MIKTDNLTGALGRILAAALPAAFLTAAVAHAEPALTEEPVAETFEDESWDEEADLADDAEEGVEDLEADESDAEDSAGEAPAEEPGIAFEEPAEQGWEEDAAESFEDDEAFDDADDAHDAHADEDEGDESEDETDETEADPV